MKWRQQSWAPGLCRGQSGARVALRRCGHSRESSRQGVEGGPQRPLLAKILGLRWVVPPDLGVFIWVGFSTPLQPEKQVSPALGP